MCTPRNDSASDHGRVGDGRASSARACMAIDRQWRVHASTHACAAASFALLDAVLILGARCGRTVSRSTNNRPRGADGGPID